MLNNEVAQQDVKDESKNKNDYKPETVTVQNKPKNRKGWKRFWRKGNSTAENAVAQQNVNDESGNRALCFQPKVENNPKVENKLKRHEPKRGGYVEYCGDDDGEIYSMCTSVKQVLVDRQYQDLSEPYYQMCDDIYDEPPMRIDIDRAGVDEEQIKASMEKGLMSTKQYQQIKQLKD